MARIDLPEGLDDDSIKLLSLQPAMGNAMAVLTHAIYNQSGLDIRVRESIRMCIANINQCQICLNFRFPALEKEGITEAFYQEVLDWRTSTLFSDKEKLAIEYAELFAGDHLAINDAFMDQLKQYFTSSEIFELTYSIGGLIANGRTLQVLQIDQTCSI